MCGFLVAAVAQSGGMDLKPYMDVELRHPGYSICGGGDPLVSGASLLFAPPPPPAPLPHKYSKSLFPTVSR